jgi:hypothetical protein
MTTGFGGSGKERSGGRGADAFQPETRERDGGKGVRYGAVAKREGGQRCGHVALGGATEEERGGSGGRHRPNTDGDRRRESHGSRGGRRESWPVGQPVY